MLVLSRKLGEHVVIGENICVTVIAVRGSQVRLGFTAPVEVSIRREELGRSLLKQTKQCRQSDSCAVITAPKVQP